MNYYVKALQNFANFNGRARRKEFWMFMLFHVIFLTVAMILDGILGTKIQGLPYGLVYVIYSLALLVPTLALSVRRVHDVAKSGWFILIPIYNLVLYCTEGTHGDNEYGSDPKTNT